MMAIAETQTGEPAPIAGGSPLRPDRRRYAGLRPADSQAHGLDRQLIPDLARHLIDSGGKRLRPHADPRRRPAGDYRGSGHIKLAAAVEFIHTATLLHDDVVDESALRRGKVSANLVWGNKPACWWAIFCSPAPSS